MLNLFEKLLTFLTGKPVHFHSWSRWKRIAGLGDNQNGTVPVSRHCNCGREQTDNLAIPFEGHHGMYE
jgi:hypothetical protein